MSVVDWFLEPARERPQVAPVTAAPVAEASAAGASWATAAVLGPPELVAPMAGAVAAVLRRRARARAAVLASLGDGPAPAAAEDHEDGVGGARVASGVAGGGRGPAATLAGRLEAHGVPASARGRLAVAELPREDFAPAVHRAGACGAPLVLAVLRPRTPELDAVLGAQDLIVLTAADPAGPLAALARDELTRLGPPLAVVPPPPGGAAGALRRAGRLLGGLDAALAAAAAEPPVIA
jgi:hypothetical protein